MHKTKSILAGFAIFASILMLSTTCFASPVEQKASIETLEYAQQELINSIEAMLQEALNDPYVRELIAPLQFDNELNSIASAIDKANDPDEKAALVSSFFDVLESKEEVADLTKYLSTSYSDDVNNVNSQLDAFNDAVGDCLTDAGSEGGYIIVISIPAVFLIEVDQDELEGTTSQGGGDSGDGGSQPTDEPIINLINEILRLVYNLFKMVLLSLISFFMSLGKGFLWIVDSLTQMLDWINQWLEDHMPL